MARTEKTPSQLLDHLYSKVGPHYYDRTDFHISAARRKTIVQRLACDPPRELAGSKVTKVDSIDGLRLFLGDESWLLIRLSGTEPLVRIYAEADSVEKAHDLIEEGRGLISI
jgi:phosphomannomutase